MRDRQPRGWAWPALEAVVATACLLWFSVMPILGPVRREAVSSWVAAGLLIATVALWGRTIGAISEWRDEFRRQAAALAAVGQVAIATVQLRTPEGFADGIDLRTALEALPTWGVQSGPFREEWRAEPHPFRSGFDWYTGDPHWDGEDSEQGRKGLVLRWRVTYQRILEPGVSQQADWFVHFAPHYAATAWEEAAKLETTLAALSQGMRQPAK